MAATDFGADLAVVVACPVEVAMGRKARRDNPGDWFHVFNRAIAKRSMFEVRADMSVFLDQLGECVERRWIEVHAFCVLVNHFHLLVRSPEGQLSRALHRLQSIYVHYFNRLRLRDGALLRGRFRSPLVDSLHYRRALVTYIDRNAPKAGLAAAPHLYAFASARSYCADTGPSWLCRDWVHGEVRAACRLAASAPLRAQHYLAAFHHGQAADRHELVEKRIAGRGAGSDPTDRLLHGAGPAVLEWLRGRALLADGTALEQPIAAPAAVRREVRHAARSPQLAAALASLGPEWQRAVAACLLRELVGLTYDEIGRLLECSRDFGRRRRALVREAIARGGEVAAAVAQIAHRAIRSTYG